MDACPVQLYKELMFTARTKYTTPKSRNLLNKIKLYEGQLVHAFTSSHFTASHISTNRSEGMMSAIKANGVLKTFLCNATYQESLDRIRQVARFQDKIARDELIRCRKSNLMVGEKIRKSVEQSKILAMKLGFF